MDKPDLQNIKKMYEKLTYFDQYGGSVILCIIITIILCLLISYCFIMINAQPIIDDWPNQRCKPNILPIAGFITHPEGVSASDYTYQNFNYCMQNTLSSISGFAVEPLTFVTSLLNNMAQQVSTDIQSIRDMFNKVRTMAQEVSQEIMGRIVNFTIPLQQIIIGFKDLMSKIQGILTAGLYTLLGSYYTLKSLMGAIAQFIISILVALATMIAVFWVIPFTWGAAIANTVIFVAIAIPLVIVLAFMVDVLHVNTNFKIPTVKCFDEDTLITANDGTKKRIVDIRVGEKLFDDNEVTACMKVETNGSDLYNLYGITVSDSHIVFYKDKWICVSKHPEAVKLETPYEKPYLYCLNTSKKVININGCIFTDWDEIYLKSDFNAIRNNGIVPIRNLKDVHTFMDGGFSGDTKIKLKNGAYKEIKDVDVGDTLYNGENVYGIVKINGVNVSDVFEYNLGKNLLIQGGPNLVICKENKGLSSLTLDAFYKSKIERNPVELYHLLTDTKTFTIGHVQFYDYNAAIDLFLDNNNRKLLSMKYV